MEQSPLGVHGGDLVDHVPDVGVEGLVGGVEAGLAHGGHGVDRGGAREGVGRREGPGGVELRQGVEGGVGVGGGVDLRDHLDVVGGRGGDDGAEVVLGVVAGHPGQRGRPGGADGGGPGDLGQAGVVDGVALGLPLVGDGNAPALVVGEVEVQLVELVVRHGLDGVQHLGRGDEGPGGVQHEAPVAEARAGCPAPGRLT